jgi:dipeptidyl aminopeptidase/acylaminoacyl peptidase
VVVAADTVVATTVATTGNFDCTSVLQPNDQTNFSKVTQSQRSMPGEGGLFLSPFLTNGSKNSISRAPHTKGWKDPQLFMRSQYMIRHILFYSAILTVSTLAKHGDTAPLIKRWQQAYLQATQGVEQLTLTPAWAPDTSGFLFKREKTHTWSFLYCDATNGKTQPAFDHVQMAKQLSDLLGKRFSPDRIPITQLHIQNWKTRNFTFKINDTWLRSQEKHLKKITQPHSKNQHPPATTRTTSEISPDGKWRAYVENGHVFLKPNSTKSQNKTTHSPIGTPSGKAAYYWGKPVWNASSTQFYILHTDPGQRRTVTLVESSPKKQLQPITHTIRYDKPGDIIDRVEPHIFSIDGTPVIKPDRTLTPNAFSISHITWNQHGKELRFEYIERGFGKHFLVGINTETRKQRIIIQEESDTFIFVSGIRYRKDLDGTNEIIWGSERDGWRHLYLIDATSGQVKHQITQGNWIVRNIEHIDSAKRQITFTACGKNKGENPYHLHWYRVNFDGSDLTPLTQGDGMHQLSFSPDRQYYTDTWSRVDHPPVHELHRASDGKKINELCRANASGYLNQGRKFPERFVCKDRNGRFDIWGIINFPPHFDPKKKYPVIENIYAGPHGSFVPKSFFAWNKNISELTEEGFIVVNIDGLGTNYRHHDFSHFAYKNLADAGFPDRIQWIKKAAQSRPYMDISRVGIYGGSAGGQSSTGALLFHGDFYKVAVSDCGCHDNRMDKIWWNEQWMDWPVGPHYAEQSNVTHANNLTGDLMLTVGELDKNVDPSSTLQLINALINADKDFEYYIMPGGGHGSGEHAYLRRKRCEFFKRHLLPTP